MPTAINPFPIIRSCAFRPRATVLRPSNAVIGVKRPLGRSFADDKSKDLPKSEGKDGPNMRQQEHVSEEAAKMAKIQGGQGPDIEGQGTPVQEILKDEKDTRKAAPKVMKEQAKQENSATKPGTRPFSTLARRQAEVTPIDSAAREFDSSILPTAEQQSQYEAELDASSQLPAESKGLKFPYPSMSNPERMHKDYRYDPVVNQVTNLLMQDGKKSVAQRNMATILTILRTAPAPTYSQTRPLLPGAPPASHLPLNPTLYLTLAVDSVAPLLRIRSQKGAAGGGMALQIPVPLGLRQRRRQAFEWILDAAVKRKSRGSGNDMFAQKVAEELIAVVEGRSSVWEKRQGVHKLGTAARANLNHRAVSGRR